jgi:RNA polymerase-binding protein DksA
MISNIDMALDTNFTKQIDKQLKDQKEKLEAQLADLSIKNTKNPNDYEAVFPNFGDSEDENAAEVTQFSNNLTLERTLESTLRDVKKALENIKEGKYGICKYCGKNIDEKRLTARPTSSSCIDCKKKLTLEG